MNQIKSTTTETSGASPLMDTNSIAPHLGMTTAQVSRLQRQGKIPCIRLGHRTHRFSLPAVMEALAKQTRAATA